MFEAIQSIPAFNAVDDVDAKLNATHLFYQKPSHAVQIIQLVEGPPPPRRIIADDSSYASSSSSYSSAYSEDEDEDEVEGEDEDEDEDECSSYCSSEDPLESHSLHAAQDVKLDAPCDTFSMRMKRILAWRENFSTQLSSTFSDAAIAPTLKRKIPVEDDVLSHCSKRSRSGSTNSLGALSCPACDASFDTRQGLRQHGRDALAGANEACFVAVDYAFE